MKIEDITSVDSESGIIASLIHKPELSFYSEFLLPNHFSVNENKYMYLAICNLAKRGITQIDPYNIIEILNDSENTRRYADKLSIERLNEFMEMSDVIARNSPEEYKLLVSNVMDAAFRRDTYNKLEHCKQLCCDREMENIEQKIYSEIDEIMTSYSSTNDTPSYLETIEDYWTEIKSRQGGNYAGIPFKFPTLNEFVTIEPGELVVFAAEAKQGKSMLLLNCAMDLLKKGKSVLYLDSELNSRLFTSRVLAHLTGIEYKKLVSGSYTKDEENLIGRAMAWIKKQKFEHLYIPMFDLQSIYTAVKKIYHTQGIDVLIIDYFKDSGSVDAWNSYAELGRFVDMIKNQVVKCRS